MKLRTKLALSFGLSLFFLSVLAALSLAYAKKTELLLRHSDLKGRELYDAEAARGAVMGELLAYGKEFKPETASINQELNHLREVSLQRFQALKACFALEKDVASAAGESPMHLPDSARSIVDLQATYEQIHSLLVESNDLFAHHQIAEGSSAYLRAVALFNGEFSESLSSLTDDGTMDALDVLDAMTKSISDMRYRLIFVIAGAAALITGFSIGVAVSITRRLMALERATKTIADGCFEPSTEIEEGQDELSALGTAFNRMSLALGKRTDELKVAEAKLITSAKLSALGEMAGGVAHEINTPLCIIKLKSELLRELIVETPLDIPQITEMCDTITSTVNRAGQIITGLRTFSRDGSKDASYAASAKEVVESALSLCRERLKNNGIKLDFTLNAGDTTVFCRPVQISQIILNLVSNSCDAISQLAEKWIKIEVYPSGSNVVFAVTDSGSGIPKAVQEKLFQPFFTTKDVGKGTGLGLSISVGIARAHQGELRIDPSAPNTKFVLTLPQAESAVVEVPSKATA